MNKLATILPLTLLAACVDDDTSTTTFSTFVTTFSTMSLPSTNATAFEEVPTTSDAYTETTAETSDTTGDDSHSETSAALTSSGDESTSTGDSTGEQTGPQPVPPSGCAVFIEVLPRTDFANSRYVVVDMSRCERAKQATLTFQAATPAPSSWKAPIARRDCGVFGGNESPAADPGEGEDGVVLAMVGTDDATDVLLRLTVDGETSDELILPDDLAGQTWEGQPDAPTVPLRRREDWAWVPIVEHVPGCELVTVF